MNKPGNLVKLIEGEVMIGDSGKAIESTIAIPPILLFLLYNSLT